MASGTNEVGAMRGRVETALATEPGIAMTRTMCVIRATLFKV